MILRFSTAKAPQKGSRFRGRWWLTGLVASCGAVLAAGELYARFGLGLGDPPLSTPDPAMEYRFRPDQDVMRFGNRIRINAFSMRSGDFPASKTDPSEIRVMVFGDSVINGGSLTDQADLATELLREAIEDTTGRPVRVGNISAGSWGPANQLAYAEAFGFFDADVVAIVVSSHDADDVPVFEPLDQPQSAPWTALGEGSQRYLWPQLRGLFARGESPAPAAEDRDGGPVFTGKALRDLSRLVTLARPRPVLVFHFPDRDEARRHAYNPISPAIRSAVEVAGGRYLALCDPNQPDGWPVATAYRDQFHPNAAGQRWFFQASLPAIRDALGVDAEQVPRQSHEAAHGQSPRAEGG